MRRFFVLVLLLAGVLPGSLRAQDADPMNPLLRRWLGIEMPAQERGRVQVDYVMWWLDKLPVPPLVTTGPEGSQAIVGDPTTQVLRGGQLTSRHGRYVGLRVGGEWWLSRGSPFGLAMTGTFLERDSSNITYRPNTIDPLARPYLDANDGQWKSYIIAGNSAMFGPVSGSINVYSRMEMFEQDVNGMVRLVEGDGYRVNLLAGAHFIQFRERLDLTSVSRVLPAEAILFGVADHIWTFNKFFGGQLGLSGEYRRGRWSVEGKGVLAYGANAQQINAKGDRVLHTPAQRTTFDYGLYVLPSNTGSFDRLIGDFVSEWNLNLGFQLSRRMRLRAGYTALTWLNPVRPGDQIDALNLAQIGEAEAGGPLNKPGIPWRTDFFWAQGLNLGVELRW